MAIIGMSPSLWFFGSVSDLSTRGLSWHAVTLDSVICLRHLPTWMTSGMFAPSGAPLSVNFPVASVRAVVIGLPV
jgi:hypothetical protein